MGFISFHIFTRVLEDQETVRQGVKQLARKKKKVKIQRVAAVNAEQLLMRDLSRTALWIAIGGVIVAVVGIVWNQYF